VTAALREAEQGVRPGPGRETGTPYLARCRDGSARPSVKARTFEEYVPIVPRIGRMRLAEVEPLDIQRLCADLRGTLSTQSVVNTYRCLHRAFDQAVRWGLIPRKPCDGVTPPAATRPEVATLAAGEATRLLATTAGKPHHAVYVLALTTGTQQGELLALRGADVGLEAGRLAVRCSAPHQLLTIRFRIVRAR
jgi:integrase